MSNKKILKTCEHCKQEFVTAFNTFKKNGRYNLPAILNEGLGFIVL